MSKLTKYYLADANVWIAVAHPAHTHHATTRAWFHALREDQVWFCRLTQLTLLRLLTNVSVMGEGVMSQVEAWKVLDDFLGNSRVGYLPETEGTFDVFRSMTQRRGPAMRSWSDVYIAALALDAGMTVVTFDKGFARLGAPHVILG